ncbi:HAMP domain-containing sensor histidine kinase [Clostridium massiliamazoniense]|uniref:HAMP domain-containing sensor histidine kinase n=1 Tax=Clostridium massiliamazoniense TaxID=1347366 RepID=UPI0006D79B18|nr:HAMP domain-containing sensor histidine kinase [Clostridium massiliamazoniense]
MKKKIITSTILVIMFTLGVITSFFLLISNYNDAEYSKNILKEYSETTTYFLNSNYGNREKCLDEINKISLSSEGKKIRIIYANNNGKILYDSSDKKDEGSEFSIIKSELIEKNKYFHEEKLQNGDLILFTAIGDNSKLIYDKDMKYYLYALIITLTIGIIITSRVMNTIIEPIEELQLVAARMSRGDFHKRVKIKTNDELGSLSASFNNMADKLEETMGELLSKQLRLTSILKSIGSGIIALDKNENIILINPCAIEIFKIKDNNLIGKNIKDVIEEEKILEAIKNNIEKSDFKITKPTERYVKVKVDRILEGVNGGGCVISIEDITDYKMLENMRRDFVANVSHELKTPITSIKGFAETLKYVDDEETRGKFLGIIEEESDRLTRLIEDILSLYEIERKDNNIIKEVFSPKDILDKINLIVEGNAKKRNIGIILKNESNNFLYGSEDRFKQMILNIVDNAIKYAGDNTLIWIKSRDIGNKIIIDIEDNGVGMAQEHVNRIFERFYRVDKARSRNNGGTGLGLAIVKHIVNNFEGTISVWSEVSKGTKFTIELPICEESVKVKFLEKDLEKIQ